MMIDKIKLFFKKPKEYASHIDEIKWNFFIIIFFISLITRIFFNIITPHDFPPEISFEKLGLPQQTISDFAASSMLSIFINLFIFLPILTYGLKKAERFLYFFATCFIFTILISTPIIFRNTFFSWAFFIFTPLIFYPFIKNEIHDYITLVKVIISLYLITIISEPFIFLGQYLKNEIIFTISNLFFGIIYIIYFIKMIKTRYDISINRLLLLLLFSAFLSFYYGFVIYKTNIFPANIFKLILLE